MLFGDRSDFLDGLLYGYHGDVEMPDDRTVEECARDWAVWGCFNFLTTSGESFNECKAFIMYPPGGPVHILYRQWPERMTRSVQVSRDGVMVTAEGFTRWFQEQAQRLQGGD